MPSPSDNRPGRVADLTALTDSLFMLIFSHVSYHKFKCVGLDSMGYMRTRNTPEILGFPRLSADGRGCVEIRKWRRVRDSNRWSRCRHAIGRGACRVRVGKQG